MVTLFIFSLLLIAISVLAYSWQRSSSKQESTFHALHPSPEFRGLFSSETEKEARRLAAQEAIQKEAVARTALLERASAGDRTALDEAHRSGDRALYDEVLNRLVEHTSSDQSLFALVSYVARGTDLRVNVRLAESFLEVWKRWPDRNSTAKALHFAALSDSTALYQQAIESATELWRAGHLSNVTAEELWQLIESEYWVLSAQSRSSGAGFILKRAIANCRRELVQAAKS